MEVELSFSENISGDFKEIPVEYIEVQGEEVFKHTETVKIALGQGYSNDQLVKKEGFGNVKEGERGDLYFRIALKECSQFRIEGSSLWYKVEVPLKAAQSQQKIEDTLIGALSYSQYSKTGFELENKGLRPIGAEKRGSLFLEPEIKI